MPPLHQPQELLHDLVQHRAAPDDGLVPRIKKSNRDHLQPKRLQRLDAVFPNRLRLPAHAQHQRDVRPVHIGVEQANFVSHLRQRDRQVHRQRGLAHAALARTHGNDGIDSGQRLRPRRGLPGMRRHMCTQGITLQESIRMDQTVRLYSGPAMLMWRQPPRLSKPGRSQATITEIVRLSEKLSTLPPPAAPSPETCGTAE